MGKFGFLRIYKLASLTVKNAKKIVDKIICYQSIFDF